LMIEVRRDEKWIDKCDTELKLFNDQLDDMVRKLQ
jgi:hypothetical protein